MSNCLNKKIEILDAYYNYKDEYGVTLRIKNNGENDIEEIRIKADTCNTEKVLGNLFVGVTKEFEIITGDLNCHSGNPEVISLYIEECYMGENNSLFRVDKEIVPMSEIVNKSKEESIKICKENSDSAGKCIQDIAVYKKDPLICNEIISKEMLGFFPENCIRKVAINTQNPDICDFITESSNHRDICYSNIAIIMNDIDICKKIANIEYLNSCIAASTKVNGD